MMKTIYKILVALVAISVMMCGKAWGQSTLTLYDSETNFSNNYSPYGGYYGWHYQVYLYDASDVNFDGTITAVSFKTSSSYSANNTANYTIYMKDVSSGTTLNANTAFSTYLNGSTECYSSGTMPALVSGWNTTPTFSNSFSHESGKSIVVIVKAKGCSSSGGCGKSVYYKSSSNHVWYKRADVSNPPDESSTGSLSNYLPAIKFTYTIGSGGGCDVSENFENVSGASSSYSSAGSLPSGWDQIYTGTVNNTDAKAPHVHNGSSYPGQGTGANALSNYYLGFYGTGNGSNSYAIMPAVASGEAVSHLKFKYKYENASNGTLTYGIINGTTASTYTVLGTCSTSTNPGLVDVDLDIAQTAGKRIAFRWYYSASSWYTAGIDDICITTETTTPHYNVTAATSAGIGTA